LHDDPRGLDNDPTIVEELTRFSHAHHVSRNEVAQAQRAVRRALEGMDRPERDDQQPRRTPRVSRRSTTTLNCAGNVSRQGSANCVGQS
jgi:hypothetical protein